VLTYGLHLAILSGGLSSAAALGQKSKAQGILR